MMFSAWGLKVLEYSNLTSYLIAAAYLKCWTSRSWCSAFDLCQQLSHFIQQYSYSACYFQQISPHPRERSNIMSGQQSQSYSTFSSSSYSSSTDSSGSTYTESTISNPSGTTVHRTSQVAGQPAKSETTRLPAAGTQQVQGLDDSRRIEDVSSEAD